MKNNTTLTPILAILMACGVLAFSSDAHAGVAVKCGNGDVDAYEECDDGNQINTDGCLNNCELPTCGDGYKWVGHEECDDGNQVNTDACLSTCERATCGDGYVWAGKEECDDENTVNGDGCDKYCDNEACYDSDGDGVCDEDDVCPGGDDSEDADNDGVPDYCDECPGGNDNKDTDGDGVPNYCDVCPGGDDNDDADNDGVPDYCDVCAEGDDNADADGDEIPDACDECPYDEGEDEDGDGVCGDDDLCPYTAMPDDNVPSLSLGVNRWKLGPDGDFVTKPPNGNGKGPQLAFTIEDTGGCNCEQIIEELGLGEGHTKFGCSISAMQDWVAYVDAQSLGTGGDGMGDLDNPEPKPESAKLDLGPLDQGGVSQMTCNIGEQPGHGPAWAFLALVAMGVGLRRRFG